MDIVSSKTGLPSINENDFCENLSNRFGDITDDRLVGNFEFEFRINGIDR